MNIFKKLAGKILYGVATFLLIFFDILIAITGTVGGFVKSFARGCLTIISMGGCFLIFLFAGSILRILASPTALLTIVFLFIFPALANRLLSYFEYAQYILTNYLFDRASYFTDGIAYEHENLSGYSEEYRKMKEEEAKRQYQRERSEQRKRQEQQQKEWEERFRNWNQYQGGYSGQGGQQTYADPTSEFKTKYKESCDVLGLSYNASASEVKAAYRNKAKKYHPDINKSADATEMFQKVNNAYEFLSEGNIERYKSMN